MQKKIIFLNRAYNDIDIQMPLVVRFAADRDTKVEVWGYAADGFLGHPYAHEAAQYAANEYGVLFTDFCRSEHAPLYLRLLSDCERNLERKKATFKPLKALHVATNQMLARLLRRDNSWQRRVVEDWHADAIIMDEAQVQVGRSYLIDKILPDFIERKNLKVYVIKTGHHVYKDFFPTNQSPPVYKPRNARYFLESGIIDELYAKSYFPKENIVRLGNLRMDDSWIRALHEKVLAPPYFNTESYLAKMPVGQIKIVMMLSKMNYGVEAENLRRAIHAIGQLPNIAFVIKPHTRGMKFNFMPQQEVGHAFIADTTPSAILCEWADLVLFTGSSIAFHAMALNKAVGYMKFCQSLETIFDYDAGVSIYNTVDNLMAELQKHIEQNTKPTPEPSADDFLQKHVYADRGDKNTCAYYHKLISEDLTPFEQSDSKNE